MHIPFVDLVAQYRAHRGDFDQALESVISRAAFIGGRAVQEFEAEYSRRYGVKHCVSCANGTDALYIALRMLGIGRGDEVITTASTWISTAEAITQVGATPVFVDVDPYFLIDAGLIEAAITPRTRAVIPVHLYGQAAPMDRIVEICRKRGLYVLEDCAQAHFAEWQGQRVGTFGDLATFSFYPSKNLGAWGDAGAIISNDDDLARRCRLFANHGSLVKHQHEIEGINSRLDGLQAALLTAKLKHLDGWTDRRRRIAARYDEAFADLESIERPAVREGASHVYHLYVVKTARRDALKQHLAARGIETAIHYPTPLPLLPVYQRLNASAAQFPRATANHQQILSLPIYPEMTAEMIGYVVAAVRGFGPDQL